MSHHFRISRRGVLLGGTLFGAAGLAAWARPDKLAADEKQPLELDTLVPRSFGAWQIDPHTPVVLPAPDVQAAIDRIYNQTVARTYIDTTGARVMLSLAYGRNQSDAVQVHKPEGCYQGQGFGVGPVSVHAVTLGGRALPVRRMVASRPDRLEPVTYYTLIGNVVSSTGWREKVVQLEYAVSKRIPDGLLVRVSSLGEPNEQYLVQERFLKDLIDALPVDQRHRFVGTESRA
jgi:EpsI family protein